MASPTGLSVSSIFLKNIILPCFGEKLFYCKIVGPLHTKWYVPNDKICVCVS